MGIDLVSTQTGWGKTQSMAVRALANVWVRIIYTMWSEHTCYETAIFEAAQHQHARRAA